MCSCTARMASFPARVLTPVIAAVAMLMSNHPAHAVTPDWVTISDPGNTADTSSYGAVADAFRIMRYEWTNSQYKDFLNAVDPSGTNPNLIYSNLMDTDDRGGISFTVGNASGSKYATKTDMGNKPVNFVCWFDAARVANWLHNGQGSGDTETGAYTLNNATSGPAPGVNPGATFYIPTENQWYKAAYYKGGSTNAGYWDYATQSDTAPTAVTANGTGDGSAGSTGNAANYNSVAVWASQAGNVTTVGTNGGASAYGTFDMSGNVAEWNDLTGSSGSTRGLRGGAWFSSASEVSFSQRDSTQFYTDETSAIGFRLASPVAVPEPSTWAMGAAGLVCGGWQLLRRRKQA
jgi:sulfatase modifying factor 1